MPRARTLKPSFFSNVDLAELSPFHRLLFAGLWCWADREGRIEDRPKQIKGNIFPFDEGLDVDMMLTELQEHGFLVRYVSEGKSVIEIPNFEKHQNPHPKEADSELPPRKEISFRENNISSGLSSVSFPSVTCHLSPDNAEPGETLQLDLEDSITEFIPNAYRRNGRTRPKLNRRQDQPLVERLEAAEQKHGIELFRECLLNYIAQDSEWLRSNGWPLNRFLQDPESYAGETVPSRKSGGPQRVDGSAVVVAMPKVEIGSPTVAQTRISYPDRWNELVPAKRVSWDAKRGAVEALRTAERDEVFVERFDEMCGVAQAIHERCGPEANWVTFEFAIRQSPKGLGWWRILEEFREMQPRNPQNPKSGQERVFDPLTMKAKNAAERAAIVAYIQAEADAEMLENNG